MLQQSVTRQWRFSLFLLNFATNDCQNYFQSTVHCTAIAHWLADSSSARSQTRMGRKESNSIAPSPQTNRRTTGRISIDLEGHFIPPNQRRLHRFFFRVRRFTLAPSTGLSCNIATSCWLYGTSNGFQRKPLCLFVRAITIFIRWKSDLARTANTQLKMFPFCVGGWRILRAKLVTLATLNWFYWTILRSQEENLHGAAAAMCNWLRFDDGSLVDGCYLRWWWW